jgi:hypothetical protein
MTGFIIEVTDQDINKVILHLKGVRKFDVIGSTLESFYEVDTADDLADALANPFPRLEDAQEHADTMNELAPADGNNWSYRVVEVGEYMAQAAQA